MSCVARVLPEIVDFFHVCEHLAAVVAAAFVRTPARQAAWPEPPRRGGHRGGSGLAHPGRGQAPEARPGLARDPPAHELYPG